MQKKSIEKRFSDFKLRNGLSNEIIAKMVREYANSSNDFARTYFKEKYHISEKTFYKSRDYAVIFCLVDEKICDKLKKKAAANYRKNNSNDSAVACLNHFRGLLEERKRYLESFSDDKIREIGAKYVEKVQVSKIAIMYETGEYAIKWLLKKGIIDLIFDSSTVKMIHDIVGTPLDQILQKREINKNLILKCIQHEIATLQLKIQGYHLYYRNATDKPSLKSLEQELSEAIKMYNETRQL